MFKRGTIVEFNARRRGRVTGVVSQARTITRGRHAGAVEYKVAPLGERGHFHVVPGHLVKVSKYEATDAEVQEALGEMERVARKRVVNKQERVRRQRAAQAGLGRINLHDQVLIRGRDGPNWTATVIQVNQSTGKVAISAPGYKSGKRWIPSSVIVEVVQPEAPCPVKLTEMVLDDLQERGVAQVRYGREFIERSYVVAFTKELASERHYNYECASTVVQYDPSLKLYWRSTGSFD